MLSQNSGEKFTEAVEKEIQVHRSQETPDSWVSRDARLIPLTGAFPFNAEPPASELIKSLITPTSLHFVRNHGPVPRLNWTNTNSTSLDWSIRRSLSRWTN